MPRKKLPTGTRELQAYWAAHPEEKKKREARAKVRNERARERRMAKHQPELTDIQSNGKYVVVTFLRNGVVTYGTYELINDWSIEGWQREHEGRFARFAARVAKDEARETLPPDPGKTPLS